MKYDITIICTENDSYLGDLICQEMEARGKSVLYNLRDAPRADKVHNCVCKSPIYIAVVNQEFLEVPNFKTLTKFECSNSDVTVYLFINEEGVVIPEKWKKYQLIDADAGWDDGLMEAIASGQPVAGLCEAPSVAGTSAHTVAAPSSPMGNSSSVASLNEGMPTAGTPEGIDYENEFGLHLKDGIKEMLLPEAPSSMMVKRALKYYHGEGVVRDVERAYTLLSRAVKEDPQDSEALYYLAAFMESGEIDATDMLEAQRLYEEALNNGFYPAKLRLGYITLNNPEPGSHDKAMEIFKECRKEGDVRASYWIGLYAESRDDFENAFEYYSEAAEEGFAPAQNALGCMYVEGLWVKQDERKAMDWFRLAADQGLPVAMANLGDLMIRTGGMSDQAKDLIIRAAQSGDQKGMALSRKLDRYAEAERQEAIRRRKEAERQAQMESLIDTVGRSLGSLFSGTR